MYMDVLEGDVLVITTFQKLLRANFGQIIGLRLSRGLAR
jgi:hypothetical protein